MALFAKSLALLLIALSFAGCGGSEAHPTTGWPDWRITPDSIEWRVVTPDRGTCRDCIRLLEEVVIGDEDGPGYHVESHWAARDSVGRYWVRDMEGAKIYSSTGAFLQRVGRSGEGPLEFRGAGPTYADADGLVHLFDRRNRRETVLRPDFSVDRERALQVGLIYEAAALSEGDRIVVNSVVRTQDGLGFPLHVVEGAAIARSFGILEQGSLGIGMMHMLRRITVDSRGIIYSGGYFEYAVDVWTSSGLRLLGIKRLGLWDPPPHGEPQPLSLENPPGGLLLAMHLDEAERLWVIAWVPRDDWRDDVTEIPRPDGSIDIRPNNSNASLYRTAIDVIDLSTGRVVAHTVSDDLIEGFLSGDAVYGNRFAETGEPHLVVWRLQVNGRLAPT